ncbi:ribonuclease domain-containing protein [Hydrogenophaga sp.]|uniref:ribonuclease domain-containing protein n=1 Tax=Hydrogenophaga sp. TaxID=1904254 RepID=UPI003F6E8DD5
MDLHQIRTRIGSVRGATIGAIVAALSVAMCTVMVQARSPEATVPALETASMSISRLPAQGQEVMALIRQGGPFRYEKDGSVFGNRERLLPGQKRGYYREYTVPTPGLSHRGARRIVCGGFKPRWPEACYYTEDHYNSFRLVVQ